MIFRRGIAVEKKTKIYLERGPKIKSIYARPPENDARKIVFFRLSLSKIKIAVHFFLFICYLNNLTWFRRKKIN